MPAAAAHDNVVTGRSVCQNDGTVSVTWSVYNDWSTSDDVSVNSYTPSGAQLAPTHLTIGPRETAVITEAGIPAGAGTASIDIKGTWSDYTVASRRASVALPTDCRAHHTPAAPTWRNGECVNHAVTSPAITIPRDNGVAYTLDARPVPAGTVRATAGPHRIEATSDTFTLTAPTSWSFTLTSAQRGCGTSVAVPTVPAITQSSCVGHAPSAPTIGLPTTTGVRYTADHAAPYHAGQTVIVTATARTGYRFDSSAAGWPAGWTMHNATTATYPVVLLPAQQCVTGTHATPAGFTPARCVHGTPTSASYTIPPGTGVRYRVNGVPTAPGTYSVAAGSSVTVRAVAQRGYTITGRAAWTHSFGPAPQCADTVPARVLSRHSGPPAGLAATGAPTGALLATGFGLVVLGALCTMLAARRRSSQ